MSITPIARCKMPSQNVEQKVLEIKGATTKFTTIINITTKNEDYVVLHNLCYAAQQLTQERTRLSDFST